MTHKRPKNDTPVNGERGSLVQITSSQDSGRIATLRYDPAADTVNGQPYIDSLVRYTHPEDMAFGDRIERTCDNCFFRSNVSGIPLEDCEMAEDIAKRAFAVPSEKILPKQIQNPVNEQYPAIEIGNYCPSWTDFRAE